MREVHGERKRKMEGGEGRRKGKNEKESLNTLLHLRTYTMY